MAPFPNCKIEVYDTADNLSQTITKDIIECNTHDVVTSGVGSFTFTLPAVNGFTNVYNNIGNNYKVKIFFGYDGSYVHVYSGKIVPFTTGIGAKRVRLFEGKGLGESLERQFRYNKRWQSVDASDIVADLASTEGYTSTDIDTDTTEETITVRTESYFDVLKKISDYWVDGSTKVQKDFGIDKDGVLFWKARPLRTSGVETFTYGTDFVNYDLKYDITTVKNNITVYGAAKAPLPLNRDDYTDNLTNYTASAGTLSLSTAFTPKAGSYWIKCDVDGTSKYGTFLSSMPRVHLRDITQLCFWHIISVANADVATARLYTDGSNYFYTTVNTLTQTAGTHFNTIPLGESAEWDADENPSGKWLKSGTPNWMDLTGFGFNFHDAGGGAGDLDVYIDKLWFYPERWIATASDATSISSYGQRDAEYTDDQLQTTAECQARAYTQLYTQKDRVLRLDFTVAGNTNVRPGDRLTLTLPRDGITAQTFDVASVDHHFQGKPRGFTTKISAIQGINTRNLPATSPLEAIKRQLGLNREVNAEIYSRVVR